MAEISVATVVRNRLGVMVSPNLVYGLLQDAGKVTAEIAKLHALAEFEKYRVIQDRLYMSDYDRFILELEGERDDSEEEPE